MFTIMVVDDNESIRKLISAYLQRDGYSVLHAVNGVEVLLLLETVHVDLMIADIMMPEMDGYALAEDLGKANYNFPILMITAKDTFEANLIG